MGENNIRGQGALAHSLHQTGFRDGASHYWQI